MDISENSKQIQIFLSVIIFGYFGVKIIFGLFFKYYPNKYYYRNIDITTSENSSSSSTTKNIALNAFVPGMWNNEMCDFITTVVLTSIILVFSYNTSSGIFTIDGSAHPAFVSGTSRSPQRTSRSLHDPSDDLGGLQPSHHCRIRNRVDLLPWRHRSSLQLADPQH